MSVFYILFPISFFLALGALVSFVWACKSGQFDDVDSPSHRILWDDAQKPIPTHIRQTTHTKANTSTK